MHRADDIVELKSLRERVGVEILLHADEHLDALSVLLGKYAGGGDVVAEAVSAHAIILAHRRGRVGGKADALQALLHGGEHHLLGRVFTVAKGGVAMQLLARSVLEQVEFAHLVIFSCLILWSMT